MGAILQPTHTMGAWTVETRRESADVAALAIDQARDAADAENAVRKAGVR